MLCYLSKQLFSALGFILNEIYELDANINCKICIVVQYMTSAL